MAHLSGEAQRKRERERERERKSQPLSLSIHALALNYITTATPNGEHRRRHRQAAPFSRTQASPCRGMTDAFTRPWFILLLAVEGVIILDWEMKRFTKCASRSRASLALLSPRHPRAATKIRSKREHPALWIAPSLLRIYGRESKLLFS